MILLLSTHLLQKQSYLRRYYVGAYLLVVLVGAVPPIVFYTTVHDEGVELMTKQDQLLFARNLSQRARSITAPRRQTDFLPANDTALARHLFPNGEWATGNGALPYDIHVGGVFTSIRETSFSRPKQNASSAGPPDFHDRQQGAIQPLNHIIAEFSRLAKGVTPWPSGLQMLTDFTSSDSAWHWYRRADSAHWTLPVAAAPNTVAISLPSYRRALPAFPMPGARVAGDAAVAIGSPGTYRFASFPRFRAPRPYDPVFHGFCRTRPGIGLCHGRCEQHSQPRLLPSVFCRSWRAIRRACSSDAVSAIATGKKGIEILHRCGLLRTGDDAGRRCR